MSITTIPLDTVREALQSRAKEMRTQKLINSIHGIADQILTPESVESARESGEYFSNTPEGRKQAAERRKIWHAENP